LGAREHLTLDPSGSHYLTARAEAERLGYALETTTTPPRRGRTLAERRAAELRAPVEVWSRPEWCDAAGKAVEMLNQKQRRTHAKHLNGCDTEPEQHRGRLNSETMVAIITAALADLAPLPLSAVLTWDVTRSTPQEQAARVDPAATDAILRQLAEEGELSAEALAAFDEVPDAPHDRLERFISTVRWLCSAETVSVDVDGRRAPEVTPLLSTVLAALAQCAAPILERERESILATRAHLEASMRLSNDTHRLKVAALTADTFGGLHPDRLRRLQRDHLLALAPRCAFYLSLVEPPEATQWALDVAAIAGATETGVERVSLEKRVTIPSLRAELSRITGLNATRLTSDVQRDLEDALLAEGAVDARDTQERFARSVVHEADAPSRETLRQAVQKRLADLRD